LIPRSRNPEEFRRRLLVRYADDLYVDSGRFDDLLERLWITNDDPLASSMSNSFVRKSIGMFIVTQETGRRDLFDRLGAFSVQIADLPCSSKTRFLGGAPDEAGPTPLRTGCKRTSSECGVELRETIRGRYPVFTIVSTGAPLGRPKNLIFASIRETGSPVPEML